MKRAVFALISTFAGLVALFGYRIPTPPVESNDASPASATSDSTPESMPETVVPTTTGTPSEPVTQPPRNNSTKPVKPPLTTTTIPIKSKLGDAATSKYGPIQVKVTMQGATLIDVKAVVYPQETPTSAKLNVGVMSKLRTEAMAAQNADIDVISGATETSQAFIESLASALKK